MFFPRFQSDSGDDEISHLEWETVRVRFVKAATLDRLVDALVTDDGELESTFVNVFLGKLSHFTKLNYVPLLLFLLQQPSERSRKLIKSWHFC